MRISSGAFKGKRLYSPEKNAPVRPMLEKIRQAVFNILYGRIEGARVLDLFAGTGSLGLEALSRGAKSAVFFENHSKSLQVLKGNIEHLGVQSQCTVVSRSVLQAADWLAQQRLEFDIVFVDPPFQVYEKNRELRELVEALDDLAQCGCMHAGTVLVLEAPAKRTRELEFRSLRMTDERKYGQNAVLFLAPAQPENAAQAGDEMGEDEEETTPEAGQ